MRKSVKPSVTRWPSTVSHRKTSPNGCNSSLVIERKAMIQKYPRMMMSSTEKMRSSSTTMMKMVMKTRMRTWRKMSSRKEAIGVMKDL